MRGHWDLAIYVWKLYEFKNVLQQIISLPINIITFWNLVHHCWWPCIKTSMQICMYDAEGIFELQNYHNQDLMLNHLVEIRVQSVPEEAEKGQEPESEPKERTMTVLHWLGGLDTLKLVLRCLSKLIQISTVQQQLDKNLWRCLLACLLWWNSEWE